MDRELRDKLKAYAKRLYLKVDNNGKQINSTYKIAKKIHQKFGKKLAAQTISNWAKDHDWNKTFTKAKQHGIEKAKTKSKEVEQKILEKESDDIAKIYKANLDLFNFSIEALKGLHAEGKIYPALYARIMESSKTTLLNLNDKPQDHKEETIKVSLYIPENDR
jgi:L-2-hydroxyglutarate oxidase LhgO